MGFPIEWLPDLINKGAVDMTAPAKQQIEFRNEKDFQAWVVALAKTYAWLAFHPYDARKSSAGFPDLVLVPTRGLRRVIFAELKLDGENPRPSQVVWGEAIAAVGGNVEYVCWRPVNCGEIQECLCL